MPVFPPQFPARVGDVPAAPPDIVISRKSQSFPERVAAVIVRVVPTAVLRIKLLAVAEPPATVNVPLTVWFALITISLIPDAGAVKERLL